MSESQVMVRYVVKPDRVAENEGLVRAVYAELQSTQPAGLAYATFVQEDGVSFVHLASVDSEDDRSPLLGVAAFARFLEGLDDRLEAPPVVTTMRRVGSYRVFGE
ncbi:hypothetical protein [Nocardioides sp.]|uniref:hypothetical protein n=1 Tax=Nocardioides sp. TaxID=35761 RepID=UPI0031FEA872|nr:hypothetical protein [Nocardioides sp.]